MDSDSFKMEEYKTLRAELLRNEEALERDMIACITADIIALTYGIKEKMPFVLVLACIIPAYFWIQHTNHRNAIAKIASYIATFLEGPETQLMWERRTRNPDLKYKYPRYPYFMRSLLLPYPVLFLVSILSSFWVSRSIYFPRLLWWAALMISCIITLLVLYVARKTDIHFGKLLKPWNEAFRSLKELEQKQNTMIERTQLSEPQPFPVSDNKSHGRAAKRGNVKKEAAPNKGMNRTRSQAVFHRELVRSGGLCAPVIPGVGPLT
jgi:hypothetical protein